MEDQATSGYVLIAFEWCIARHLETIAAALIRSPEVSFIRSRIPFEVAA